MGFNIEENVFYDIRAKAVLCATGGAQGFTAEQSGIFKT